MFGIIDTKVYLFLSFCTTALLYAIDFFDRQEIVKNALLQLSYDSQVAGMSSGVANLIIVPIVYAVDNTIGAIIAGILWPIFLLWMLLFVVLFAFSVIAPGVKIGTCTIDTGC